jgi:hypothetical protein
MKYAHQLVVKLFIKKFLDRKIVKDGSIGHEDAGRACGCGQQTDVVLQATVVIGEAVAHEEESHGRRRG